LKIVKTEKNDQVLAAEFLAGDETAFEILYNRYKDGLYTLVLYQTEDGGAADLFQDIIIKFYKNLDKFQQGENLKAWLVTIAINSIRDYWRKKNRFKKLFRFKNALKMNWNAYKKDLQSAEQINNKLLNCI